VARMGEKRKLYKIRMDLREIGLGRCGLDSTGSVKGRVASCCECGDEPVQDQNGS
jgi:hypothetical protein